MDSYWIPHFWGITNNVYFPRYSPCNWIPHFCGMTYKVKIFLEKTGGGSEETNYKTSFSICLSSHLSQLLNKTGGASAMQNHKTLFCILHCTRLSLFLNKIGGGSEETNYKTSFSICLSSHLSLFLQRQLDRYGINQRNFQDRLRSIE